jgi:glutamate synthase domain-containing protein 2/glutamate synthase domain-containing protein 1/glutamate synthase domain-containing protein 3
MPLPHKEGLYDPQFERDACGIGFVVNVNGRKSHDILEKGIQVLLNLQHRGACGCDPETGDGAGVTLQAPHEFFDRACYAAGMTLPNPGEYGVGMVFLPVERTQRLLCEGIVEDMVRKEGQRVIGWRDVPVDPSAIGQLARSTQPFIRQVFIGKAKRLEEDAFERKLYVIRKRIENRIRPLVEKQEVSYFYVPSMSARTVVYKGLMLADQIKAFYQDLSNPHVMSALALVHQRFSTNTFPTWELAHPFRYIAHNGEINTLKGNVNWMHARESVLKSDLFNGDLSRTFPIISPGGSDSANIDNALELLMMAGRSIFHSLLMLIPEAWATQAHMDPDLKAFYEYHASLMEPWDGPAAIAFTDGRYVGAILDRNGLRPCRYTVTYDDFVVLASETGVLSIPADNVKHKDRLQPGRMLLIDTVEGRIISDEEIKDTLAHRRPYGDWLRENLITIESLPKPPSYHRTDFETILMRQRAFGYTDEDLRIILAPMATQGEEPVGSMGNDAALACLSDKPRLLFDYFKQLFAQVTNPPIDPIREELVMSLVSYIGKEGNILDETPRNCHTLKLPHPILTNFDLEKLRNVRAGDFQAVTIPTLFPVAKGGKGLERALAQICTKASKAARSGYPVLILSDRGVNEKLAPIPSLLALSAVHHHLIRDRLRTQVALIVESGEPREVMHFALLIGYGASAVNPYLAIETLESMIAAGQLDMPMEKVLENYLKSIKKGLLKTISKMGISTIQSYCGAQIFEAVGLDRDLVKKYFTGTTTRISGVGLDVIARECEMRHGFAMTPRVETDTDLDVGGQYQYRVRGERHLFNPVTISKLQHAVRQDSWETYKEYSDYINEQTERLCTLRGLFRFKLDGVTPIPLEEVEPASEIVKRFKTGAMSFGSISKEAHETLAIAMNRIGGKSNTGEGGEDEERFRPDANGDWRRSAIKQVASARFGVTTNYLVNADELQIKMAQGAKPGEGGQLPGHKVDEIIARIRHSIPGVQLISPPPHHDIYSIEDLAQLIYDLKNANPRARISVKLVAEAGVGIVAAGVSKAHADVVLISGHDGGTGASPLSSIKHAGIPWEIGLAETQQVLVKNDLRGRIVVETDGQMKTGRDVAVACLLGAEEFGFATAPLVTMGCIMMRKCHLNTCPVGVATQDPKLRARFQGQPEHVINFFFFVAEELRQVMAQLGFRTVNEMVGRSDLLDVDRAVNHWKACGLDFSEVFFRPEAPERVARYHCQEQNHGLDRALDWTLVELAEAALERRERVDIEMPIQNTRRTVGAILSGEIARRYGSAGLPDDTIHIKFHGSAGQSFGAFLAKGVTLELEGDTCDYMGKGLSGGRIIIYPPSSSRFVPEENIIVGNVCLYGATGGEVYLHGMAGERFAVRNSGALAVVEGAGDHCCEYMTKGCVVVLGRTGRNFAAGMSSGIAFVLDELGDFGEKRCNLSMVGLEPVVEPEDIQLLHLLIERHCDHTGSPRGRWVLEKFGRLLPKFVKVMPHDYRKVLAERRQKAAAQVLTAAGVPVRERPGAEVHG